MPTVSYELITPATLLPVSLDDAKGQLRVLNTDEDARITQLIKRAAAHIEIHCGIVLAESTWRMTRDVFPVSGGILEIRKPPVQSITSVTYLDSAGDVQTVDTADYRADVSGKPARLRAVGNTWPTPGVDLGGVAVTFVAGSPEGSTPGVAAIPDAAAMLILLLIEQWYEAVEDRSSRSQEMAIKALMADLKWAPMSGFGG